MMTKSASKRMMIGLAGLSAAVVLGACQQEPDTAVVDPVEPPTTEEPAAMDEEAGTIVDVAAGNEDFSTLVQAIEAAGLAETLSADGPYTVFAPTNAAFDALPEGTLDQLLLPENQETLTQLLTYHVLPAEVMAADVSPGEVVSVAEEPLTISVDDATGDVMVNNATVIQTDIPASNGVIHAVDQVILPLDAQL